MKSHLSFITRYADMHDGPGCRHLASLLESAATSTDAATIQAKCAQFLTTCPPSFDWPSIRIAARLVLFERIFPLEHAQQLGDQTLAAFVADIASLLPRQTLPNPETLLPSPPRRRRRQDGEEGQRQAQTAPLPNGHIKKEQEQK